MKGMILDYEYFAVHDGPGIRFVVFLKGCPLRCLWCHTPQSQYGMRELIFNGDHCLGCGSCGELFKSLPVKDPAEEMMNRVGKCPTRALAAAGYEVSAEEVISEAEKQLMFFRESGGGLTVSGGEPLFQAAFTLEILQLAEQKNISCCIETCGYGKYEDLKRFIPYTEIFLYDYKISDPERHKEFTGVDNHLILENLRRLDADDARIVLRCPIIPGINDDDEHLLKIAETAEKFRSVEAVHIEPFNPMARGKYLELNRPYGDLPEAFPSDDEVRGYTELISRNTSKSVVIP